jgi:DNA-binding XRE family transcriptional regulator
MANRKHDWPKIEAHYLGPDFVSRKDLCAKFGIPKDSFRTGLSQGRARRRPDEVFDRKGGRKPSAASKTEFGRQLKLVLARHGILQADICKSTGLPSQQVGDIANGRTNPSPPTVVKMIEVLPVSAAEKRSLYYAGALTSGWPLGPEIAGEGEHVADFAI